MSTVRRFIQVSWDRSMASSVNEEMPEPSFMERVDSESVLLRAARPVLASLAVELANEPACLILTDAKGVVLQRGGGSRDLLAALDRVRLSPGFSYSEGEVGTNGIGTAVEVGGPVLVTGEDHFAAALKQFSCGGALIHHPITGVLLGVVDITTAVEHTNSLLLSFAKLAARRIQERILEEANDLDASLLGGYYAACRHSGGPVIAVSDKIFMMNTVAQQHFDAGDQAALLDQTRETVGRLTSCTFVTELPSGIMARLAYQPNFFGDRLAGGIIQIKEHRSRLISSPTRNLTLPGLVGNSAAWQTVTRELLDTLARDEWSILEGEAGSGKGALIRAAHEHSERRQHLEVIDASIAEDLVDTVRDELAAESDLAIRNVHLLDEETIDVLSAVLHEVRASDGTQWVTITTSGDERSERARDHLLPLFPRTIAVPPLRHHLEDLPALVRALLNKAGAPELMLSQQAMNQLMRLPWQGNITQLQRTLATIVRTRRSGVVEVQDLPAECLSTTRRNLNRIEAIERDAIVEALTIHAGDKVKASESLGISRATIYRKIRDYGITI